MIYNDKMQSIFPAVFQKLIIKVKLKGKTKIVNQKPSFLFQIINKKMGNTCNGQQHISHQQHQISSLSFKRQNTQPFVTRITYSDRFRHQVEKLKIDGNNMYKLILPVEGQRSQVKVIQCKFMFSYADMGMSPQYQFTIQDMTRFPIIDIFQPTPFPSPQIYHKITSNNQLKLLKYYNFTSFTDYTFKSALYQLSLYQTLPHSKLSNHFILFKGQQKQLVMIFDYCYVSLHDVLYYRKMAGYEWSQKELLMVMRMMCEQMVEMVQIDIVHRDIRPSNIFFVPVGIINSGQEQTADGKVVAKDLFNESINGDRFYALFNFASARMVDRAALINDQDQDDIFTVKGSSVYTQGTVRDALLKQQHKANYNPYYNDIIGLKNTLIAMVNLQPTNVGTTQNDKLKNMPKIQTIIKYMTSSQSITIQQVAQKVNDLLGINPTNKPDSYYTAVRNFYLKQLTICQNIQTNLYLNTHKPSQSFSLAPQSSISSIDSRNTPLKPPNPTIEYIQSLYIKTLYDLHKKDTFVTYMLQKLAKNFENSRKEENVVLLMKVGQYFEDSGVRENQYYKEAILLLTELAEQQRVQGFYKDHQRLVSQAQQVYSKFSPHSKLISRAKCMYLKQKAYKQMLLSSEFDFIKHMLLGVNPSHEKLESAQQIIFQAYQQAQKANLPIQEQLELIYAKGQLSMYMNKVQQGETFFFNGYQIAEKNYKEFLTVHNCSKYKGMFEYVLGMVEMAKIRAGLTQRTPKILFEIEQKLQKAKQRFSSVKIHPVHVIKCYIALGDLAYIRQDGPNSTKNYQRALNLLHAQNQTRTHQTHPSRAISARVQIQIVSKLIDILNKTNNQIQAKKYQQLYQSLKKQFNLGRKSQSGHSRKSKFRGKKDNWDKSKQENNNNNNNNLAPIQEVEEENKMFESKAKPLGEEDQGEKRGIKIKRQDDIGEKDNDHVSEF